MNEHTGGERQAIAPPQPPIDMVVGGVVAPIIPRTVREVAILADALIKAGVAPDSYTTENKQRLPDDVIKSRLMIGIMKGAEVGFPPIHAINTIAIINGRPCIWGDGVMALILKSGKLEWHQQWEEGTPGKPDWTVVVQMKRKDQDQIYEGRFSLEDAARAKLLQKTPWIQYPQRMLRWRAFSWPARDGFADVLAGISIAEEIQDLPERPTQVDVGSILDEETPAQSEEPQDQAEASPEPEPEPATEEPEDTSDADQDAPDDSGQAEAEADLEADARADAAEAVQAELPTQPADEPTMAERYRIQMFEAIDQCDTLEDLEALQAEFDRQKVDFQDEDGGSAMRRVENRFAMRKKEFQ